MPSGTAKHGTLARIAKCLDVVGQGNHVVQDHGDVAAQPFLDLHGPFGRKSHGTPVGVSTKYGRFIRDFGPLSETEQLKAAAVSKDGAIPTHELVQSTELFDDHFAGPHGKMVSVGQHDLSSSGRKLARLQALYRALRTHRHKCRCFDTAVCRVKRSSTSQTAGIDMMQLKFKGRHAHIQRQC